MQHSKVTIQIKDKIADIEAVLRRHEDKYESMGLNTGLLGLSAFYYYFYIRTNDEKYLEDISRFIADSFNGLNENYKGYSSVRDIVEIGKYLHFLKQKGILEEDVNEYLEEADQIVLDFLNIQLKEKNIDPITGAIKAGYYFLKRNETKSYSKEIELIIALLEKVSVTNEAETELFWYNNFHDKNIPELELGFTHGIAGIVNFIISVHQEGILCGRCEKLIVQALNFLLKHKSPSGINLFPFEAINNTTLSYQNLCYGDPGIGLTFLRAGKILHSPVLYGHGVEIIENAAQFRDDSNEYIKDATLLYGASGLFSFFKSISKHIDSKKAHQASKYWFNKMSEHDKHDTLWAGYRSYFNNNSDATQLCFSEGICGIGISLIANELLIEGDHLSFLNYTV